VNERIGHLDQIERAIRAGDARGLWRSVTVVEETDSTNEDLRAASAQGARAPALRVALRQQAGRGTQGRTWHSPRGGLYLSALVRTTDEAAAWVGFAGAWAVARGLEQATGAAARIKWPNDLLLGGAKVGGVLAERWPAPAGAPNTIVGIGLNLNMDAADFPPNLAEEATSVRLHTGRSWPLSCVAGAVARALSDGLDLACTDVQALRTQVEARLARRGEDVCAQHPSGQRMRGRVLGLDGQGALRLRNAQGRTVLCGAGWRLDWARVRRAAQLGVLALVLLSGALAPADVLYLVDGETLEGPVERVAAGYRIKTRTGTVVVPEARVEHWEERPAPEEEYAERRAAAAADDVQAQFMLALWCKAHDLPDRADEHFARVFALEPDHEEARRAAGYVRHEGEWLPREEYMREQGYRRYGGTWMPEDEAERKLAEDQELARLRAAEQAAFALIDRIEQRPSGRDLGAHARQLAQLGSGAVGPLTRALHSMVPELRAVAIAALGGIADPKAAHALVDRVPYERSRAHFLALAEAVTAHPRGEAVRDRLFQNLFNAMREQARLRVVYLMRMVGDRAFVPALIREVDRTPFADNRPLAAGVSDEDAAAPLAHVRPAVEALEALTGQDYGKDRKAWEAWWAEAKDEFAFQRKPLAEEDEPGPLAKLLQSLSKTTAPRSDKAPQRP